MKNKAALIILAIAALCPAASLTAQSMPTIEVHAKRYAFVPAEITLTKGQAVKLELISDDVTHSLRVDDLNVNVRMPAGGTVETIVTPDKTGDFKGKCGVFCGSGHGQMLFVVHVVDGK